MCFVFKMSIYTLSGGHLISVIALSAILLSVTELSAIFCVVTALSAKPCAVISCALTVYFLFNSSFTHFADKI